MERIRLRFENIQQIVGNDDLSVMMLTDETRQRALSVICDAAMTSQLLLRLQSPDRCAHLLPEALVHMLPDDCEMMIYGVHDGQYQVVLQDRDFTRHAVLRLSDAVLLHIIANYPLYIESTLMQHQSVPFDEHATGVAIPINSMDTKRLHFAMQKAVSEENYELASQLRDEIKRRKQPEE